MRRAVYAGSFDPLTLGHLWMVDQGRRLFDELVVAIGINPDKKYLFTLEERMNTLRQVTADFPNVTVASFENLFLVHYAKQVGATFILRGIRNEQDYGYERGMRYVNAEFDESIQTVFLVPPRDLVEVSSSFVKGLVGPRGWQEIVRKYVPEPVYRAFLERAEASRIPMAADEDLAVLKGAWAGVCAASGVAQFDLAFGLIEYAYSGPTRHYHNVRHVADCLREFAAVRPSCQDAAAVEAALLFHDYEYEPTRHDNEERSADEAAKALRAVNWPGVQVELVRVLILATRHAAAPATPDACVVVDIDLSILGQPPAAFDGYERAIRKEYAHVPDDAFRTGRATILSGFLSRPRIYATDYFASRYEMSARENLGRSLAALRSHVPAG